MGHRALSILCVVLVFQLGNHLLQAKDNGKSSEPATSSKESSSEEETTPVDIDTWDVDTSSTGNGLLLRGSFFGGYDGKEIKPKHRSGGWDEEYSREEEPEDKLDIVIRAAISYKDSLKEKLRLWAQKAQWKLCESKYFTLIPKVSKFCGFQNLPTADH